MCAGLHNICIDQNDPLLQLQIDIPVEEVNVEENWAESIENGRETRDFMANNYFGWFSKLLSINYWGIKTTTEMKNSIYEHNRLTWWNEWNVGVYILIFFW